MVTSTRPRIRFVIPAFTAMTKVRLFAESGLK
jgi:hypothetical protein